MRFRLFLALVLLFFVQGVVCAVNPNDGNPGEETLDNVPVVDAVDLPDFDADDGWL